MLSNCDCLLVPFVATEVCPEKWIKTCSVLNMNIFVNHSSFCLSHQSHTVSQLTISSFSLSQSFHSLRAECILLIPLDIPSAHPSPQEDRPFPLDKPLAKIVSEDVSESC